MRKELISLFLIFAILFFTISLFSYSSADPCAGHNFLSVSNHIENFFGLTGAYIAGTVIYFFGIGAFWLPILLSIYTVRYLSTTYNAKILPTIFGALILIVSTGSIFLMFKETYVFMGETEVSAGGILGSIFKSTLVKYANIAGTMILLIFFLIFGLIFATGISMLKFITFVYKNIIVIIGQTAKYIQTFQNYLFQFYVKQKKEKLVKKNKDTKGKLANNTTLFCTSVELDQSLNSSNILECKTFQLPSIYLLNEKQDVKRKIDIEILQQKANSLEKKLNDFNISGQVVDILPGPVITTFEYRPASGIKLSKIVNLTDDLALALSAISIRIVAPIPGRDVVGIEIPNNDREFVTLRELINSDEFINSTSLLTLGLGKDLMGRFVVAAMDKMPHLLIAGATGTGKSVGLNAMIISLLYKATPDQVQLIMIDPKRIEFSLYNDIPHLLAPVITDMKEATNALLWAVREMERRYELMEKFRVRHLVKYNEMIREREEKLTSASIDEKNEGKDHFILWKNNSIETLPYIVIIIDELSDLMMVASKDVEFALTRLAQMARAAGIHIILATQRPSVDVLTGTIKANFPTRISFQVSSKTDGRIIIDQGGAESLLGNGDMLFCPPGTGKIIRIQGAYISEKEISKVTSFLKKQRKPEYQREVIINNIEGDNTEFDESEYDEKYDQAVAVVTQSGQASISYIQRKLHIGYKRAVRILEIMEREGIVGSHQIGSRGRDVFVKSYKDQ